MLASVGVLLDISQQRNDDPHLNIRRASARKPVVYSLGVFCLSQIIKDFVSLGVALLFVGQEVSGKPIRVSLFGVMEFRFHPADQSSSL
jgi:hypothetical protein